MKKTVLHNKYSLVKGAARRARQLQSGAPPTIVSASMKACRVAQDEIRQGRVGYTLLVKARPENGDGPTLDDLHKPAAL